MGVWDGVWQASQAGLMFMLGAGVLVVVIKFIFGIIGMTRWNQMLEILATLVIFSMVLVKLFGVLDDVDKAVSKGRPAPQTQQQNTSQGR